VLEYLENLPARRSNATSGPTDTPSVARQIDPDTLKEYDALTQRRDTHSAAGSMNARRPRRTRSRPRLRTPKKSPISAPAIAILHTKPPRKKYEARLPPLLEENQPTSLSIRAQSADMGKIPPAPARDGYAMRDSPEGLSGL